MNLFETIRLYARFISVMKQHLQRCHTQAQCRDLVCEHTEHGEVMLAMIRNSD